MSDPIVLQVLDKVLGFLTVTIAAILLYKQNKAQKNQVKLTDRVGDYHTEVNGNMKKLLKTTKDLAKAEQLAKDKINGGIEHIEHELAGKRVQRKPLPKKRKK